MMTLSCLIFSPRSYRQAKERGARFVWLFPASVLLAVLHGVFIYLFIYFNYFLLLLFLVATQHKVAKKKN